MKKVPNSTFLRGPLNTEVPEFAWYPKSFLPSDSLTPLSLKFFFRIGISHLISLIPIISKFKLLQNCHKLYTARNYYFKNSHKKIVCSREIMKCLLFLNRFWINNTEKFNSYFNNNSEFNIFIHIWHKKTSSI